MVITAGANPDRDRDREHSNIGTMDPPEEDMSKKLNDDIMLFMRKRSEHEAPRYTARLKTVLDIHQKRRKAASAREHRARQPEGRRAKADEANKDNQELSAGGKHRHNSKDNLSSSRDPDDVRPRRRSRSFSLEPSDRCRRRRRRRRSCRRRRRSRRRRRRRSCGRRRRRRRSCRRRRRRRSRRRRHRRRSCRRRCRR